jgi:hypothetical protein
VEFDLPVSKKKTTESVPATKILESESKYTGKGGTENMKHGFMQRKFPKLLGKNHNSSRTIINNHCFDPLLTRQIKTGSGISVNHTAA